MSAMFIDAKSFNDDISNWDVSSATDMSRMFAYAKSFDGDLSKWDVSIKRQQHVWYVPECGILQRRHLAISYILWCEIVQQ